MNERALYKPMEVDCTKMEVSLRDGNEKQDVRKENAANNVNEWEKNKINLADDSVELNAGAAVYASHSIVNLPVNPIHGCFRT